MIRIGFRFDDPARSSDHQLETAVLDTFAANDAPITLAVVPFESVGDAVHPLTTEHTEHLRRAAEQSQVEFALHGYSHISRSNEELDSEFSGVQREHQEQLLRAGRAQLALALNVPDTQISGLVPPWNTFDGTTMKVAAALGFRYLSAGWTAPRGTTPTLLPRTCHLSTARQAMTEAATWAHTKPMVIVVLHHYDFEEFGGDEATFNLATLDELLKFINQSGYPISTIRDLAATVRPGQLDYWVRLQRWRERQHWRIATRIPGRILPSVSAGGAALPALRFAASGYKKTLGA